MNREAMNAAIKAEARIKDAIQSYEQETGIPVVGCAVLEEIFSEVHKIYLFLATLDERKFSRILPHA